MKASELNTSKIWYSASNEDTRSEGAALAPKGKSLLCITASGSRTFDLLIEDPARILSIDQNPSQTAFAQLFALAYQTLDYAEFSRFVGLKDMANRRAQLMQLLPYLPSEAAMFWRNNARHIDHGLLYCGKWEGYLRQIQWLAGAKRRNLSDRLLSATSLDEQYSIWAQDWDDRGWHIFLGALAQRWLWVHIFREPGMQFIPREFDIKRYASDRFDHVARHIMFANSPFAWMLMKGRYETNVLPAYLTEQGFDIIRKRIDRVHFLTASLQETFRESDAGAFDGASLSDYSSYCDVDVQRSVWTDLSRVMATGGRVCERKFFNKSGTHLPTEMGFQRHTALEEQLFIEDRAFFYSFVIAEKI